MSGFHGWRGAVRRRAAEEGGELADAVVEELSAHLEDLEREALAGGATAEEARAAAAAALQESNLAELRRHARRDPRRHHASQADIEARASRDRRPSMLDAIRIAVRQLRQHPRFALLVILVIGLGLGAAATVFSVVDAVVLEPLPFAAPDHLVALWDANAEKGLSKEPMSPVNFMDYRALPVFEDAAAWWRPAVNLVDPGLDPLRVSTIEVSGNLFDVLGVRPQIGPGFPVGGPFFDGSERLAVISDRLWRTRYGADPSIIGRQLSFNGTPYTILGVMPPKLHFPDDVDVWQRLEWDLTHHSRYAHFMEGVARLAPGTSLTEAQAACDTLAARLAEENPASNRSWSTRLVPLLQDQLGYYRPALLVLFGAVGLLLVIGVLDVASLLLTRALSRDREMAVRVAMGASPRQLLAQLMAESLVLSLAGAVLGIAASWVGLPLLIRLVPVEIPRLEAATVNLQTLGLGVAAVALITVVLGLVPAHLLVRDRVLAGLRWGERGSSRSTRRLYFALVVGELALACALLVTSALLVRTVRGMTETPVGVRADDVLTASIQLSREDFDPSAPPRQQWLMLSETHLRILDEVRQQPGVLGAGATNFLPLDEGWRGPFAVEGEPPPARAEDAPQAQLISISGGYLETMGAELAAGRSFAPTDGPNAPPVVVVNETFAHRFLPGDSPVGRMLRLSASRIGPLGLNLKAGEEGLPDGLLYEVVGVVRDVRDVPLGQEVEPAIYYTIRQFPFAELTFVVDAVDRETAFAALRHAVEKVAPTVPVGTPRTWGARFAARTAEPRLLMTVLTFFALLAALLAATGVYGLFSWSVAMRKRELAIRQVLGAAPGRVGWMVVAQSALLVAVGLAVGLALIRVAQTALATVLYGVTPGDPTATGLAVGVLAVAAAAACVPPVLRAVQVDPTEGLRIE